MLDSSLEEDAILYRRSLVGVYSGVGRPGTIDDVDDVDEDL